MDGQRRRYSSMLAAKARRRRFMRRLSIVTPVAALFFYLAVRTRPSTPPSTPTPPTPTPAARARGAYLSGRWPGWPKPAQSLLIWSVHFVLTFWQFITTLFELVRGWRGLDWAARCECAGPCLAECGMLLCHWKQQKSSTRPCSLSLRKWLVVLQYVAV